MSPTITPLPTNELEKKLTELTPIITNEEAFRMNAWDGYNKLCINDIVYDCGIGIRIPIDEQLDNSDSNNMQNTDHKEYIEYSLSSEYSRLECELGVDTSTYEYANRTTPSGKCRVVFQNAKSDDYLAEDESILYDTGWFNYRLTKKPIPLDVSQVETLRITVYWEYNPDHTKQNCVNIAIINPVLYLKKT